MEGGNAPKMLFPPLVDTAEDDDKRDNHDNSSSRKDGVEKSSSVLSDNLLDRFQSMRGLLRKNQQEGEEQADLKQKQRQMALETALLIESEMSRLESGIAELENLLAGQQQQQQDVFVDSEDDEEAGGGVPIFPSLPSVVVAVDDDDDTDEIEQAGGNSEKPLDLVTNDEVVCDS